ncbi:hypothetical protein ACRYG1_23095 [Mycobacteroides abscessus]
MHRKSTDEQQHRAHHHSDTHRNQHAQRPHREEERTVENRGRRDRDHHRRGDVIVLTGEQPERTNQSDQQGHHRHREQGK